MLFFRPRGRCKALLGNCLATRIGATLLQLRGKGLAASCPVKGVRLLQAAFVAARPPAVLLLSSWTRCCQHRTRVAGFLTLDPAALCTCGEVGGHLGFKGRSPRGS